MNRRHALKRLGLSIGYTLATPTIVSMLQSCKTEAKLWVPNFFTLDEGLVVKNIIDLILPKTQDVPGALDLNVPEFLDLYISKTYTEKRQKRYKKDINAIMEALPITEKSVNDLKTEDYDALLSKYLKTNKKQQLAYKAYNDEKDQKNEDALIFQALDNLRNFAIWAFKTSEQIGENVLAYDPVPGIQKGCIPLNEATGGKAWSL
ncbi:gluconate 2-dehydrogenase subunit 3 family protein [Gelatiniphilus marinus]|uniref:Gluconate 2-dehydrogenase subunit 3 family protein n=1 Tax=Gelatiniphilus marinus TaxID=1759464 RepID=A0ABW5JU04_9FLAO